MPRLSLCTIVRNEAALLGRCLRSVEGVADQVVVADTGSNDGTPDIARGAGALVVEVRWTEDFSAARNAALACATGDWVLVLDADEVLPAESVGQLTRLLDDPDADAYRLTVRNLQAPGQLVRHVDAKILRLFRRHPSYRFTGAIHESVEPAVLAVGGRILDSPVLVLHDGYATDHVQGGGRRSERNLRLLEKAAATDDDPYLQYQLGVTWHGLDRRPDARRHFQRALEGGGRLTPALRALAATKLSQLALVDRRYGSAVAYAERALGEGEAQVIARFVLGLALAYQGRHGEALSHLEWVAQHGRDEIAAGDDLVALIDACRRGKGPPSP